MNALQFNLSAKKLSLTKIPIPDIIDKTDVIVQVAYSGICGTDLRIISGAFPCSKKPVVLGHEFSGVVNKVGPAVTHVKPGDRVAVDPQSFCSTCLDCASGKYHYCTEGGLNTTSGIFRDGGWAQYTRLESRQIFKLPNSISLKQGALCEPLSCISWGWNRLGEVPLGRNIVIIGAGIIGNFWSALFHHKGHRKGTVVEPQAGRRALNKNLETGFDCITPDELQNKYNNGFRADVVVDCSGVPKAIEQGFDMLKAGGKLCLFGVAHTGDKISLAPYEIFRRELTILGVMINPFNFPSAVGLIDAMGERYFDYKKLGIVEYSMEDNEKAFATLKKGDIAKAMFVIDDKLDRS